MATAQTPKFAVGSLVTVCDRDWIVLPTDYPNILKLRPLSGAERETCGVHVDLEDSELRRAELPIPDPQLTGGFIAGKVLCNASRLTLCSGAGPFRSLGRQSVRPRPNPPRASTLLR
jgi:hypothetical protein